MLRKVRSVNEGWNLYDNELGCVIDCWHDNKRCTKGCAAFNIREIRQPTGCLPMRKVVFCLALPSEMQAFAEITDDKPQA